MQTLQFLIMTACTCVHTGSQLWGTQASFRPDLICSREGSKHPSLGPRRGRISLCRHWPQQQPKGRHVHWGIRNPVLGKSSQREGHKGHILKEKNGAHSAQAQATGQLHTRQSWECTLTSVPGDTRFGDVTTKMHVHCLL